jgi:guanylate kinase
MPAEQISFDLLENHPLFIVISGPSGVGKDATLQELKKRNLALHFIVTATTRAPRPGEIDGKDYFFHSKQVFESLIASGQFFEHSLVYDDLKGIPLDQVVPAIASGLDVIIRVDVQGAKKLRDLIPDAVLIFLLPSSVEEWNQRLDNRNTETVQSKKIRMEKVRWELEYLQYFDYMVTNRHNCLGEAVDTIVEIIHAEHHKTKPRKIQI